MSTTLAKKETLQRKWYVIDAAGKPLGRTAVTVANLLRGKHKVDFTPNVDCGDFVIVINTDKAILTGKKLDQKHYYRVSGWIGGLK
ncbi:MAG: 50S ribosomal protein L13, partial [Oscillospiraceae bacterium]|nr:50S ribosomal protein L13 [Oscillospiraceae bacterium]